MSAGPDTLQGRVVLLTGASQGIGAASARILAARGAAIVGHHRGAAEREDLVGVLGEEDGQRRRYVAGDYLDDKQVDGIWEQAVAWQGHVDVLVLNAAMMHPAGGVDDDPISWDNSWQQHYQVNVQAPARLMRAAVRHFRERSGGVIILISSWVAQRGASNPSMLPYAASKAAIKAVAQSIARSYAEHGVLCYIIAPGIVRTRMSTDFAALQGGEDAVTRTLAMKEWVPPAEIGEIIAFLATGQVRHLSGATLDVNGATYIR
ncbi:MAG: SDR family oxidoreductase [Gammaproteobacteria bacterium]|nr:SDR family oxidoreductase [Gammaproteobacteria bacterium]MDH4255365.1 SDR family oxidoreductase [Gammaproteobacteria bacterium]MDH5311509.1 SDR family oxidoreductase [Gammaproteobacteria bacterium]